ncbi:ABC transporter ATP-binding protein [Streptomyces radicis]|uniref:ABC transporter ATP-binding protein n=1 Tax=Streptomyces radicis TaxID=1750517 RepID=A0A3A9W3G9_9ACTN|nr:ABC transporter ATP-binding protein [Streptomyces radicis]RKN07409.1 ABC transporter ATP-binding protein [Streptomyces radicis]RKN19572.1 ABC transporter ATP-binding protein [Streptomyces radicis]
MTTPTAPTASADRPPPPRLALRYLAARRGALTALGALLLLSTAMAVVTPQLLRRFIDRAAESADTSSLASLAAAFMALAVLTELLLVAGDVLAARVAWSATNELRVDLTRHVLGLDLAFSERHSGGELIERIDGDVGKLANFFSRMFLLIVSNSLLLLGIGVALAVQDWRVGLCYAPLVVGAVLLLRRLVGGAVPASAEHRAATARLLGHLAERLGGLEDIGPNGARDHVRRGFWAHAARLLTAARGSAALGVRWPAAAQGLASFGLLLAVLVGALLLVSGQTTVGGAYVFVAYAGMLQMPLLHIAHQVHDLEEALAALGRVGELFAERGAVPDGPGRLRRTAARGMAVELAEVSFGYGDGAFALRGVSLRLAPGERLAVLGRTGAGKSTLTKLLFRLADPDAGRILFDGQDLRGLSVDSVRRQVGLVTQEVWIFHATVRENVAVFDPGVPDEDIRRALCEVGLGDWLERLPHGLDTVLGSGGVGHSAGEAQLLAFARVLIVDPGLVVLDEASSRLDPAGRRAFRAAAERLLAGRTAVVIAHQVEAARTADRILVLRDGEVLELGRREALLADPGSEFGRRWRAAEVTA